MGAFSALPTEFAFIKYIGRDFGDLAQSLDEGDSVPNYFGSVAALLGPSETFIDVVKSPSSALLYADFADDFGNVTSFGSFSEVGDQGFVRLRLEGKEIGQTFGFLEISRGSLNLLTLSTTTDNALGFTAPSTLTSAATVPLPAPLALLGFGVVALFGLRRFKSA